MIMKTNIDKSFFLSFNQEMLIISQYMLFPGLIGWK